METTMKEEFMIRNMVCQRCIEAVGQVFKEAGMEVSDIRLGSVTVKGTVLPEQKEVLQELLSARGFDLLDDRRMQLINQVKSVIIEEVHYRSGSPAVNFSTLLSEKLHYDYSYLSRLFSSVEGRTIEKYVISQKIERVKELLTYGEHTLSGIAHEMGYSSVAHLSAQFRKVTGMTPTEFRSLQRQERRSLDTV